MSFFSSKNHHAKYHHAKKHHRTEWDNSYDYQNYATAVESMPIKPSTNVRPNPVDTLNNGYGERIFLYPRRVQEIDYERAPLRANSGVDEGCDVDAEAEDFIKFEHKKFAAAKSMSAI
ncbi:hypothetical protein HS088_TW22G00400 [Tripterygium wilfordii]|uniref:Uncharacterized protein n=1 Tax=Tripterygium wilfordii TaxID=458696 RepID=A0A7J7BY25_TRIWF|nr:hypothetical protein HS088_TW22G00400 [Tripterygium wilfordii]